MQLQASVAGSLPSINLKTINNMAENFTVQPEDHIAWFVDSCSDLELSKTFFFFVLLQSLLIKTNGLYLPFSFWILFFLYGSYISYFISWLKYMIWANNSEVKNLEGTLSHPRCTSFSLEWDFFVKKGDKKCWCWLCIFARRWWLPCTFWKCFSYSKGWVGILTDCWRCSFGRGTRGLIAYGCLYLSSFLWRGSNF